jgi:hypothetical protein
MCGACGERGALDWARPFLAGLPARTAVARAVQTYARPGLRVSARGGGWLVSAPTGRSLACSGLTELAEGARPWLAAPGGFSPRRSGRLTVPQPDTRRGVRVRIDPSARPRSLVQGSDVVVGDAEDLPHVLAQLAGPPWSLRCYLAELADGTTPPIVACEAPESAADLLVWLELSRDRLDAVVARCPLAEGWDLDIEVRAGHVVRSRAVATPARPRADALAGNG